MLRAHHRTLTIACAVVSAALLTAAASMPTGAAVASDTRAPAYGPAANGPLVFARDGDIYVADANGQRATSLISGPDDDAWPTWSRDGSQLLFERRTPGSSPRLMLADPDGGDMVAFADIPGEFPWSDWSPDVVHFAAEWKIDERLVLQVLTTDGSEPPRTLDLGEIELLDLVGFRPPDGREIVFTGRPTPGSAELGFYAIGLDGTGLRLIGETASDGAFQQPTFSPDGSTVAFWNWEPNAAGVTDGYLHLRDLSTGADRALDLDPAHPGVGFAPRFSPDGSSLLFETGPHGGSGDAQLVIAPLDGQMPARPLGESYSAGQASDFSPDGTLVLQERDPGGVWLIDVATGVATPLPEGMTYPSWRRQARTTTDHGPSTQVLRDPPSDAGTQLARLVPPYRYSIPADVIPSSMRDDEAIFALAERDHRKPFGDAQDLAVKTGARGLLIADVTHAKAHPCPLAGRIDLGDDPSSFLADMRSKAGLQVVDVIDTSLDGHPAVAATSSAGSLCGTADIHLGALGGSSWIRLDIPSRISLTKIAGSLVLVQAWAGTEDDLAAWLPIAARIIDSIRFTSPGLVAP